MEYVVEDRYVCEEHGFDKTALTKGPNPKMLKKKGKELQRLHLRDLQIEFGCTDPVVTTKFSELMEAK